MSRFAEMRNRSASGNSAEQLAKQLNAGEKYEADERYWTLGKDPAGNGSAVIRFLPSPAGEEDAAPYVKVWSHGFKGPTGQWYIEKSLTTLGKPDPVSEHNQKLWATETKENQTTVRSRKRGLRYVSNIYVIKDPANPANEGKVFLFSYGQKIMDKITAANASDPSLDQVGIDPFDFWGGANFRLRTKLIDGGNGRKFPNYESSEFMTASPLLDDDAALETIWNQQYSLKAEVAPDKFKSYDELKARFYQVICEDPDGTVAGTGRAATKRDERVDDNEDERTAAPAEKKSTASFSKTAAAPAADEDDEDMAWFKNLEADLDS